MNVTAKSCGNSRSCEFLWESASFFLAQSFSISLKKHKIGRKIYLFLSQNTKLEESFFVLRFSFRFLEKLDFHSSFSTTTKYYQNICTTMVFQWCNVTCFCKRKPIKLKKACIKIWHSTSLPSFSTFRFLFSDNVSGRRPSTDILIVALVTGPAYHLLYCKL